jgi:hypothetical protein
MSVASRFLGLGLSAGLLLVGWGSDSVPLVRAHAHNDYEHGRPLLDALDRGFCSVEADIHLVESRLLVAHDRSGARADRTLERLYLDPLAERVRRHGGRVYPGGSLFTLLIDFKTGADETYVALRSVLDRYASMLTEFAGPVVRTNAVTVVISGNRPFGLMSVESRRLAALDGRLKDLAGEAPVSLIPLVSDNWAMQFTWRGEGTLPVKEAERLRGLVQQAHRQGRRLRFWALPDKPAAWQVAYDAGVDLINTDRLAELAAFLRSRE